MTKKELLKVLSDRYVKASHEFIEAPIDTPTATRTHAQMHLLTEVLDMVLTLPKDAPEPEPPKKAPRMLQVTRMENEEVWTFSVWAGSHNHGWGQVHQSEVFTNPHMAATAGRAWMAEYP